PDPIRVFGVYEAAEVVELHSGFFDSGDLVTSRRPEEGIRGNVPLPNAHSSRLQGERETAAVLLQSQFLGIEFGHVTEHDNTTQMLSETGYQRIRDALDNARRPVGTNKDEPL